MSKPAGRTQSDAARRLLRHEWQHSSSAAQDIETRVAQLLSDPAQEALDDSQLKAAWIHLTGQAYPRTALPGPRLASGSLPPGTSSLDTTESEQQIVHPTTERI